MRTRADPEHRGYRLFFTGDVERALAALTAPALDEFDEAGVRWLCAKLAACRYKVSRLLLYRWHRIGCPWLGGAKLRVRKRSFASSGTRKLYERWFFNEDQLKAVDAAKLRHSNDGAGNRQWLTPAEVRTEFGRSMNFLQAWRRRRCPLLGGRTLGNRIECREGRGRYGAIARAHRVYLRSDLEQLNRQRVPRNVPTPDCQWLTAREALTCYGLHNASLHYWREVSCIYLDDRKRLPARQAPFPIGGGRTRDVWQYSKAQLELIKQRRAASAEGVHRDEDGVWLAQRAAMERFDLYSKSLIRWRKRALPCLGGLPLRAKRVRLWSPRNKHGRMWVYHEAELRKVLASIGRAGSPENGSPASDCGTDGSEQRGSRQPPAGQNGGAAGIVSTNVAQEPDPFAPYEPPNYFRKFDISSDTLRQARRRGSLRGIKKRPNGRCLYSVPRARQLWWDKFEAWELKQRIGRP